jgi:antitoxin component YwqK of YwqJK toxin-antitoxin module
MKDKLFIPRKLSSSDSRYTEHNNAQKLVDGVRINQYDYEGNKTGIWEEYHSNGGLMSKGSYKDNRRDGYWEWYYSNGKLYLKGSYKNGSFIEL